jgi:hypothetical protein
MRCTAVVGALLVVLLGAVGCEDTTPSADERVAVEAAVNAYLEALADAYSTLDASCLEGHASGAEILAVRKVLKGLVATGDRVESTLRSLEIESMNIFREVNATVTLLEVWDVVRYDAHTGVEKGRNSNSVQNSIIQLRLMDGAWVVTARRVVDQSARSRWKVTTPTPAGDEDPS